ncbi:heme peroxidase [Xylariaceae sp. FL0255]|nr:heme peroxidase [Xylariaceae sp. FL0255]
MALRDFVLALLVAGHLFEAANAYVWPDATIDVLESTLYEQNGNFIIASPAIDVQDCNGLGGFSQGRNFGSEWLRTVYHDMITHNATAGTEGVDASIFFELSNPNNVGVGFLEPLNQIEGFRAPVGVPDPSSDIPTHEAIFANAGFNVTDMITMCGHTVDGVQGVDFPEIVPVINDASGNENTQTFDATTDWFDNSMEVVSP